MTRLAFDEESTRRIAATVRRVEQMPRTDGRGGMTAVTPIPFQIQRFIPIITTTTTTEVWSWDSSGFFWSAPCHRLYKDSYNVWKVDTATEYTIINSLISTRPGPEIVVAYHRHDSDWWEVIEMADPIHRAFASSTTIPAFGVGITTWRFISTGRYGYRTSQCPAEGPFVGDTDGGAITVNGPTAVDNTTDVPFSFVRDRPARALYGTDSALDSTFPVAGQRWGPAPGSWKLWPGLPGFVCVGDSDSVTKTARFIYDVSGVFVGACRTTELGVSNSVQVYPREFATGPKYNGAGGLPNFPIECFSFVSRAGGNALNIFVNELVAYTTLSLIGSAFTPYVLVGDYTDVPLGTIVLVPANGAAPTTGWTLHEEDFGSYDTYIRTS